MVFIDNIKREKKRRKIGIGRNKKGKFDSSKINFFFFYIADVLSTIIVTFLLL